MKAYLWTTGILFALIVVAHIWRITQEKNLGVDPVFLSLTLIPVGLSIWAFCLLRRGAGEKS